MVSLPKQKKSLAFKLLKIGLVLIWSMLIFWGHAALYNSVHGFLADRSHAYAALHVDTDISGITDFLYKFWGEVGCFPSTEEGLKVLSKGFDKSVSLSKRLKQRSYLAWDTSFQDAWGQDYRYIYPGHHNHQEPFDLFSIGQDGVEGTLDDINNWSENTPWKEHYKQLDFGNKLLGFLWDKVLIFLLIVLGVLIIFPGDKS